MRPTSSPSTARCRRRPWLLLAVALLLLRALIPAGYMLDVPDGGAFALAMCDGGGVLRWPDALRRVPGASVARAAERSTHTMPAVDGAGPGAQDASPRLRKTGVDAGLGGHGPHGAAAEGNAMHRVHAMHTVGAVQTMAGLHGSAAHPLPTQRDAANDGHAGHHGHGGEAGQHDGPCPFWASLFVALGALLLCAMLASPPARAGRPLLPGVLLPRLRRRPAQRGARAPPFTDRLKMSFAALGA